MPWCKCKSELRAGKTIVAQLDATEPSCACQRRGGLCSQSAGSSSASQVTRSCRGSTRGAERDEPVAEKCGSAKTSPPAAADHRPIARPGGTVARLRSLIGANATSWLGSVRATIRFRRPAAAIGHTLRVPVPQRGSCPTTRATRCSVWGRAWPKASYNSVCAIRCSTQCVST